MRAVPAAAQASTLVLPVAGLRFGDQRLPVLDADQVADRTRTSVDPLRPVAHVRANAVEVGDDRVLSNLSRTLARALMSTLLSAECIGVARWATDTASEYAKVRVQFGRPIGSFQAIKHKCADMLLEVESAKSAAYYAALVPSRGQRRAAARSPPLAKAYCSEAYFHAAAENIQIHGGIGFTWEHAAHLYYRRAIVLAACFGALPPTTRSRWSTSRPRPACGRSTSTSTPTPRRPAARSARKWLR